MLGIGDQIRKLRTNAELSQNILAERAKVSPAFIYKLEAGKYGTLSIDKSKKLASGLGMTFRDFLEAVGLLEDTSTPKADLALISALRKRGLNSGQVKKVVSFVDFIQSDK